MKLKDKMFVLAALIGVLPAMGVTATFHVDAQKGRDDQPGTAERPFATLAKARDAVRAARRNGKIEPAVIELTGDFDVTEERQRLTLNHLDNETTWQAGPRGARWTGAYRLAASDFAPVTDEATLKRLRESARGKVFVCDLKKFGLESLKPLPRQFTQWGEMELFASGRDMTIARYPNAGWIQIPQVVDRGVKPIDRKTGEWEHGYKGGVFTYEGDEPARWDVAKGVYMKGFWCHDWCSETLRVASIDTAKKQITSEGVHTYGIGNSSKWHTAKRRYYVYNLLEELDAPGEWFLDRETRLLYFYPIDGKFDDVALAIQKKPLISLGGVTNVTLKGLSFKYTSGLALEVAYSQGVTFDNVEVSYVSQTGIKFWDCRDCVVSNCRLWQIGGMGLQIHGGDRKTLTPSGNRVTGCEIHHCARLSRISGPCLNFSGCGNRIDHNSFHDTPYIAVTYGGNDNVFEYNDVACAMMESGDGGGVYTGRDWGSQGNVIRYNYFHHFGADGVAWRKAQGVPPEYEPLKESVMVMGLYLDDCDSGDTVYGNLFYKAGWAMFCGGGRDNKWRDNLCIDCTSAAQIDIRGLKRARPGEGTKDGWDLLKKLQDLNWQQPPWSTRYPWLVNVMENDPKLPIGTEFTGNVAIRCGVFFKMWGEAANVLRDRLVCADNVLVGPTNAQEAKWFVQTNDVLRAKLRFESNAEIEGLVDKPRAIQDSPAFKKAFPKFPRIPLEEIGVPSVSSVQPVVVDKPAFALVGATARGRQLLHEFLGQELVVTAVADTDAALKADRVKVVNDYYASRPELKIPATICQGRTASAIFGDASVKGVIVAEDLPTRTATAVAALKAGKDVWCEAPIASTGTEARMIAEAVGKNVLAVAADHRAAVEFRTAAMLVRNGALGKLLKVECRVSDDLRDAARNVDTALWALGDHSGEGLIQGVKTAEWGVRFVGEKGRCAVDVGAFSLAGVALWKEGATGCDKSLLAAVGKAIKVHKLKKAPVQLPKTASLVADFAEASRQGRPAVVPVAEAVRVVDWLQKLR